MRKTITTIALALGTSGAFAQITPAVSIANSSHSQQLEQPKQQTQFTPAYGTRGGGTTPVIQSFGDTIFTETFSNGLSGDPGNGSWTNAGNANWEYRGPGTNPDNTVGSRGAYAGPNISGNQGDPIASQTQTNSFMIFDSDYLDNNGDRTQMGMGPNPTPHQGELETPSMDFSGYNSIYMGFSSFYRRFLATQPLMLCFLLMEALLGLIP